MHNLFQYRSHGTIQVPCLPACVALQLYGDLLVNNFNAFQEAQALSSMKLTREFVLTYREGRYVDPSPKTSPTSVDPSDQASSAAAGQVA